MTATVDQVLAKARTQLGGYYPGVSPYGDWYGDKVGSKSVFDSASFCAMGLSWVFSQVGALDIFPLHAYTPSGASWFKAKGQWHTGLSGVRRGDVVFYDWPGSPNRISHVGIVESVNGDGSINTIEFNTSGTAAGDQRNGRAVVRKTRKLYVVGYGRPKYSGTPSMPAEKDYNPWGWSSSWVKRIQAKLIKLGYNLGPNGADGDLGKLTSTAVRAFQKATGLTVDGSPGSGTDSALDRAIKAKKGATTVSNPVSTKPKPSAPQAVKDLQNAVGADDDGSWGNDTDKRTHAVRMASGYQGVKFPFGIKYTQRVIGTDDDGDWGNKSVKAHDAAVVRIQKVLKAYKFYTGKVDGKWGSGTDAAFVAMWRKYAQTK